MRSAPISATALKPLWVCVAVLLASGCCIPWPVKTTVIPEVTVAVTGDQGPISGADVVLARYVYYPHFQADRSRRASALTNKRGEVRFAHESERETVFPLMMHGVPGYGWQLCVEATGYRALLVGVEEGPDPAKIDVRLERGSGPPCSELLGQSRLYVDEPLRAPDLDAGASFTEPDAAAPSHPRLPTALEATATVRVYSFDMCEPGEGFCDGTELKFPVQADGGVRSRSNVVSKELTPEQVGLWWGALADEQTYGGEVAACFFPRHALAFFDADGALLGQISICFECNQLAATPSLDEVPAVPDVDPESEDWVMSGFSESGTRRLLELCASHHLGHCDPPAP